MNPNGRFVDRFGMADRVTTDGFFRMPLLEMCADQRVLIENHKGICSYSRERIVVNVTMGQYVIEGDGLSVLCMSRYQLVIGGSIKVVTIDRRDG